MRTAKCKFCHQDNLKWENTNPTNPKAGKWFLVDFKTGERHVCERHNGDGSDQPRQKSDEIPDGQPEPQPQPQPRPKLDPPVTHDMPSRPSEAVSTPTAADSAEQAAIEAMRKALGVPKLDLDAVKDMVEKAVQDRIPQPIVIQLPSGDLKQIEHAHYLLPSLIQAVALRFNTFMVGPAGSGKSTAARQAAESLSLRFFERTMGPATTEWDLVGYRSPDGKVIDGILREPYENGGLLFLDELDNSNPETLTTLNGALANGHCSFFGESVPRHPDFVCVAAGNTYGRGADRLYVGRQQLDAATLDRFWVIEWDYDEKAEIAWAGADQTEWVRYVQSARHAAASLKLRVVISPRASIDGAKALRANIIRPEVESCRLWAGMSDQDHQRITSNLQ